MDPWQISDTVSFVTQHNATKIGLQFPDHLLQHSAVVESLLKEALAAHSQNADHESYALYIMADTTFASCCVDEIAAEHVHAQVIVHYGWTCCSPTNRTPVLHVLGKKQFDIQLLKQLVFIPQVFEQIFASFQKVLVLYEPHYAHCKQQLMDAFQPCKNVQFIVSRIHSQTSLRCQQNNAIGDNCKKDDDEKQEDEHHFCGFYHPPLLSDAEWNALLSSGDDDDEFRIDQVKQKYCILYIGDDQIDDYAETASSQNQLFLSLLTNFGSCFRFISYNPHKLESFLTCDNASSEIKDRAQFICTHKDMDDIFNMAKNEQLLSKILLYRYSLIEKIRNSDIIGIVCANLVVPNYLQIIRRLKQCIRESGKKSYMFSIGKINQAKLGNFSEVDIFVVITCPMSFHYLLPVHQQSFFKNIVTPFDVMMALQSSGARGGDVKWTGMYSTDFGDILRHSFKMGGVAVATTTENALDGKQASDMTTLALRGKSGALVKKDATDYMIEKRTWKGVEVVGDDVAPSKIELGLSGIASQYEGPFK